MTEFQKYIQTYVDLLPGNDLVDNLKNSGDETLKIFGAISEEQANFAYAEGKWSLKEMLQHLIDAERIFAYRALRFARNDKTELAGWDEELYGKEYLLESVPLRTLLTEFDLMRKSNIMFFAHLQPEVLARSGVANRNEISVETLGKLIAGHNLHHLDIVKQRYLK